MDTTKLIQELEKIQKEHGPLTVMFDADVEPYFEVTSVKVAVSDGNFPKDWNMPKGFKYIRLS
jgi:hypothetical protein